MRLALLLSILLMSGFTTRLNANGLLNLDESTTAKACLDDPPPSTETFMTSLCEGFAGIEAEEHAHRQAWAKIDAMGCDAVCRYHAERDVERAALSTTPAATDVKNFPLPPAAQACLDAKPSASNDPEGFLRCVDITEVAAADHWKAMYVARHPETKVCRGNPSPSDPARTSRCARSSTKKTRP